MNRVKRQTDFFLISENQFWSYNKKQPVKHFTVVNS